MSTAAWATVFAGVLTMRTSGMSSPVGPVSGAPAAVWK